MSSPGNSIAFLLVAVAHGGLLWLLGSAARVALPVVDSMEDPSRRPLIARMLSDPSVDAAAPIAATYPIEVASQIAIEVEPPAPIEAIAADAFERARPVANALDAVELERLQGIYRGQLFARLARLLELRGGVPRTAAGECVVNVVQDERGEVLDVTTDLCALTREEQTVIVSAIRSAAPLPLPPVGLAMGSYLSLDLSAL